MTTPDRTPTTWHLTPEQRRIVLGRQLAELRAWADRAHVELTGWHFTFPGDAPVPLRVGQPWPRVDGAVEGGPVVFETSFVVPAGYERPELDLDVGGEGLVRLSTGDAGGLNPHHRRFPVAARPGETVTVRIEAVPKGLFGAHNPEPRLRVARLAQPEPDVAALAMDLGVLLDVVQGLEGQVVAAHLLTAAEDALAGLTWPSDAAAYAGRPGAGVGADMGSLWSTPQPGEALPLSRDVLQGVKQAREKLTARLKQLLAAFPPQGALALSGHAHLDLAWLWPFAETRRKGARTFETVLNLMDRYPDMTFNQSSAQLYAWIEQDHPELFARIAERVREGRWEPVGGMWVEPDAAMTGGESMSRQLLYGQRYFQEKFGRRSTVAWLPDTFGFTGQLPQLLRQGGITGFFTTKLSWNETTAFPHDVWWWEGIDGSRVLGHMFKNDIYGAEALGSYNGDISAEHLLRVTGHDRAAAAPGWRGRAPETLFTYGLGDGAGGPSAPMLERYERLREYPGMPRLRHARVDGFYDALPTTGLPVWVGELYFQLHRGTLSSQGRTKRLHRQLEARLVEADVALALARWAGQDDSAARAELETHWKTHLLHEFHDVLPGSSIREVYAEAEPTLRAALDGATAIRDAALGGSGDAVTVVNPSLFPRPLTAVLPGTGTWRAGNTPLPAQAVEGGTLVVAPGITVPPLGHVVLTAGTAGSPEPTETATLDETPEGLWLGNASLRVLITPDGQLARLVTAAGRDALGPQGHRLVAFRDLPRAWEAWDINPDTQDAALGEDLPGGTVTVLERGPLRVAVQVIRSWRSSTVTQTIRVTAGSPRVDIHTHAEWHERRTLIKAFVDVNARSDFATVETAYGAVRRPTHRNQASDAATFEGSAHRFADLSEPGFGLALLNDGRYGHAAYGSELSVTLLRGPIYPDAHADLGEHEFTYALLPHAGEWTRDVVREATDLNSPLVVAGSAAPTPPVRLEGLPVALGTLKAAEDGSGVILRVYEPHGARGEVTLYAPAGVTVTRVTLIEDDLPEAIPSTPAGGDTHWTLTVRPFEVISVRLSGLEVGRPR
ncbi:alpha-mannosidase [Deinococcus metalli]|uniref:Alpha-mannosidase n=1 Tax=Deinococcus metalli TaxID=1141878 RepID=A0A7W8KFS6_9DEIO|nr:glycoside hydrolase family 38 C-terminal domain-containing protein [Deinococcus metalli]MBB5375734.1 alpha-mannosidase [Deinococcus metalli]GHF37445.1 alpha-mannosidase [Deinococcus metalli]